MYILLGTCIYMYFYMSVIAILENFNIFTKIVLLVIFKVDKLFDNYWREYEDGKIIMTFHL